MEEIKKVDAYEDLKRAFVCFTVLLAANLCQYIKEHEKEIRHLLEDKEDSKNGN